MEKQRVSQLQRIVRSKAFTLFVLLAVLILGFGFLSPVIKRGAVFFQANTLKTTLQDLSIPAFLAIGAGCLMVSGSLDFSQARVGAFAGIIVAAGVQWWGLSWYVAVILALALSAGIGLINAILVNELKFQPFIATMAMSSIIYAVMYLAATDKTSQVQSTINFTSPGLSKVISWSVTLGSLELPGTVLLLILAFIVYGLVLSKTRFGRQLYLLGGNATAARLSGINAKKTSYFLFINCSILSGIAGIIYTGRSNQGSLLALANDQFTGMTAAILGGISFGGGSGGMGGAFLGLLVIKTFSKGLAIINVNTYLTNVLSGALLLAALTLDYFSQRRQMKRIGI
ncbi:MAG: ABC transporter permease [Oscillospiraceae bacterium]|jgi:ribose/xylose/arabinose/galactoside ABC-type transport system permease subunit|nr:ABC transporter permease [Oscillospiraceae bacterium]